MALSAKLDRLDMSRTFPTLPHHPMIFTDIKLEKNIGSLQFFCQKARLFASATMVEMLPESRFGVAEVQNVFPGKTTAKH